MLDRLFEGPGETLRLGEPSTHAERPGQMAGEPIHPQQRVVVEGAAPEAAQDRDRGEGSSPVGDQPECPGTEAVAVREILVERIRRHLLGGEQRRVGEQLAGPGPILPASGSPVSGACTLT